MNLVCWNCAASLDDVPRPISRHATCSECFNELHCCRMCKHFDRTRNMQCFEDRADPPLQKENANFCEFFAPSASAFDASTPDKSNNAKQALTDLFGEEPDEGSSNENLEELPNKSTSATDEDCARKKLDDLFK